MDRGLPPMFIRQPRSKAVSIINPDSGVARPAVAQHNQPATTFPVSFRPTMNNVHFPALPSANKKDHPVSATKVSSAHERGSHEFNIYARPFVPEAFTIINKLEGPEIHTPGIKQIDFAAYVGRCIGWDFLPPIPRPIGPTSDASLQLVDSIIHTRYEEYFQYHLEAEIQSQKLENESYSLFGHDIAIISHVTTPTIQTTCSFLVPGLREYSPYVEEDDVIQLRQLLYDAQGRLLGMDQWLAPNSNIIVRGFPTPGGRWRGEPAPGWTAIIYNARVLAVQRRENRLVVRVDGLVPRNTSYHARYPLSQMVDLKFNIQFPISHDRYIPMKHVLPIIQEVLSQENRYSWLQSMLFPIEPDCEVQSTLNPGSFNRPFFDQELNWEQKKSIESICSQNYGTLPFLISGPPGTGKTKTLVEVALQLVKSVHGVSHVLFCAPSDPAADMIVQRISSYFNSTELLRLNRSSRAFAEVPGSVLPFCCVSENHFDIPRFNQLMACKLIVTTCRDASLLLHSRVTNTDLYAAEHGLRSSINPYATQPSLVELHWTALIMDEAAQAMEPEALIPLSVIAPPPEPVKLAFKPLFIMAGDENQLGPRTSLPSSPLGTSLFARLFARPVYANHPLARRKNGDAPKVLNKALLPISRPAFANLIRNYRSHPAILAVPSAQFYADTLEPEATDIRRLASWSQWRGTGWPVLFHNSDSDDDMEMDNGGWYNRGEAQIACAYAAHLVKSELVAQNEVCIMSPFKAQVKCLRATIKENRFGSLWDVDIGPTEAFQGLERGVVILCTTRSKQQFVESDKKAGWGIIGFPNRMNVALTRAKFGLIVIGRREVLHQDPNWKAFLDFCYRNGLVAGEDDGHGPVHDGDNVERTRLEKVLLAQEQELPDSEVLKVVNQDDEMWTSGMQAALDVESVDGYISCEQDEEDEDEDEE